MARTLNITLDLYNENRIVYKAKQGDANSRFLLATITELGVPFSIPAGNTVYLKVRKPDETCTLTQGVISDGKVLVELTNQTLAVAGIAYCEIRILQNDPIEDLKTIKFTMQFDSSVFLDEIVESTDEFTALEEALAAAGSIGKVSDLKTEDKSTLVAGVNEIHDEVVDLQNDKEDKSNKVTSIDSESTDSQYPSAKLTYDQLALKEPNLPVTPSIPADKFLNGNRSWAVPAHNKITDLNTDADYQHITTTQVSKLTNIEDNAEVNIVETISIDNVNVVPTDRNINLVPATAENDGIMSSEYAGKLDGIAENANNYTHPNHTGDVTSDGDGATTIANDAVTNSKLANMTRGTVKVGGTDNAPTDLNAKTDKQILIGNGTDLTSVAVSGDVTISNLGAVTIGNDKVSNAKLSNMPTMTIKGNNTGATADPVDLTVAQTKAMLDIDDLEEQINSVPVSDTAYGLIEAFENAEAGVMQDLLLKGYTSTNLVENFTATSDVTSAFGTIGYANNEITVTYTSVPTISSTTIALDTSKVMQGVIGNKYYCEIEVYSLHNIQPRFYVYGHSLITQTLTANSWQKASTIITATSADKVVHMLMGASESGYQIGEAIKFRRFKIIDLTATYGAGNEPDLATCNLRYPNYFDGTVSTDKGEVSVIGKNLFDKSAVSVGKYLSTNGVLASLAGVNTSDYIPVKPSTSYRRHHGALVALTGTLWFYDKNKIGISSVSSGTFTTLSNAYYIRFDYSTATVDVNTIQLELGTTATAYEPYNPTRARYPKLQSVPAITDTFDVLGGVHTRNVQDVAITSGTAVNTTNYPLAKDAVGFVIALTAGGTQTGTVGTDSASGNGTLYYQLAKPVLSYYPPKSIPLEINSSIQHDPILSDIGFYSSGVAITDTDYLIEALEEVYKVDTETGIETPIDILTCTVAGGGLSFTSTALTDGDLVWFRYEHSNDSTVPTTDYTYTTSLSGGLTTIQQDLKKQNESLQKQIDELRAVIASMAV